MSADFVVHSDGTIDPPVKDYDAAEDTAFGPQIDAQIRITLLDHLDH